MSQSLSDHLKEVLTELAEEENQTPQDVIQQFDNETLQINDQIYRIVENYRNGFDLEAFKNRYQDFFDKYDFIVGDWAYDQLRLKGFYQLQKKGVPRDQTIDFLDDYLKEYCSYGASYFVLATEQTLATYNQLKDGNRLMSVGGQIKRTEQSSASRRRRSRKNQPRGQQRSRRNHLQSSKRKQFVIKPRIN